MSSSSTNRAFIRVIFFFLALISFIALAWSGEYRTQIDNILYIILMFILLLLAMKSIKSINRYIYLTINVLGIIISIYFLYESIIISQTSFELYVFEIMGFIALIGLSYFIHSKEAM